MMHANVAGLVRPVSHLNRSLSDVQPRLSARVPFRGQDRNLLHEQFLAMDREKRGDLLPIRKHCQ